MNLSHYDGSLEDYQDRFSPSSFVLRSSHFSKIPTWKKFWTNLNSYVISLLRAVQYHFNNWMVKCSKILHTYFLLMRNRLFWLFYYCYGVFAIDALIWKILIVYRKFTSGYAYILDFLCYFGCNNQKLFSIFVIIKSDRLNIGITVFIDGSKLQIQFSL